MHAFMMRARSLTCPSSRDCCDVSRGCARRYPDNKQIAIRLLYKVPNAWDKNESCVEILVRVSSRSRLSSSCSLWISCDALLNYLTLDLESNFEKLRKTRIFGFFSILQFLVSALEIPSRFRFRSGSLDFSSFGTMDLLVRRRPEEKFDFQNLTTIRNGLTTWALEGRSYKKKGDYHQNFPLIDLIQVVFVIFGFPIKFYPEMGVILSPNP